jgi:hypothetical protein
MEVPLWDIEAERRQAQHFALKASLLEQCDAPGHQLFRELATLCDRKVDIFKTFESLHAKFSDPEWIKKFIGSGPLKIEDLDLDL